MTLEKETSQKLLAIDLDGDINTVVYGESLNGRVEISGLKVITLLGVDPEKKEGYLAEKIAQAVKELQITHREASVSFRGSSLYFGRHTLPDMPAKEIPNALRWQFKDIVSYPQEEVVFDYEFIKETTDADGAKNKHFIVTLGRKEEVDKLSAFIEKCGLIPVKMNVSPFCTAGFLFSLEESSTEKIYATLEIGWTSSIVACYQKGKVIFSRLIPAGVKSLIQSLETSVTHKGNLISLKEVEAWQILNEVGIPQNLNEEWHGFPLSQILVLMRPELERLSTELNRSLEYFTSVLKEKGVEKIFVTGIGAKIDGLIKFLSENINTPIEILPLYASGIAVEEKELYTSSCALGNILSHKHKVNLLPKIYRFGEMADLKRYLRDASLVISAILLFSFFIISIKVNIYKRQLAFLKQYSYIFDKISGMNEEIKERERIESLLKKDVPNFSWVLKDIARVIPSNAMLAEVNMDGLSRFLEIKGLIFFSAYPENTLTDIMNKIEGSRILREAQLDWLHKDNESKMAEFKLTIRLR